MEKVKAKLEMLTKDSWSAKDIAKYEECSLAKAYEIRNQVIKLYGSIRFNIGKVSVDNYFKAKGIDRAREIEMTKLALIRPSISILDSDDVLKFNQNKEVKEDEI